MALSVGSSTIRKKTPPQINELIYGAGPYPMAETKNSKEEELHRLVWLWAANESIIKSS